MGSHERKASPGFTDYIRFQHVRSTPVLRLIQQKLLINNSIKMRYSFALLAGVAAASYIPEAPSSSSVAPSSSAKGYGYGDYAPKPSSSSAAPSSSAKGYGGDYWPKSSSSSSVKAPYVPKSSSAPYKPTYTTIECEGPPSPTAARLTLLRPRPPGLLSALTSHTCQSQSQSTHRTPQPSQLTPHRHPSPRPVLSRSPPTLPSTTSLVPVLLLLVSSAPLLTFCKFPRTACFVSNALGLLRGLGVPRPSSI